jgi:hypothetical protein
MSHREDLEHSPTTSDRRAARRRFLKVAGAAAVAAPVIESLTGVELVTTAARAQSDEPQGFDGAMAGDILTLA